MPYVWEEAAPGGIAADAPARRRFTPRGVHPGPLPTSSPMPELDDLTYVLVRLDGRRQRATYGAVAGHLGASPRTLMRGRPRDPLHSWVVSRATGLPTGYTEADTHPDLLASDRVLATADALAAFLAETPAA